VSPSHGKHNDDESLAVSESIEFDDISALKAKYKLVRRENQQLRSLLKQNDLIIQRNIEHLKESKAATQRLCLAITPIVTRLSKETRDNWQHEEIIAVLDRAKHLKAEDLFA
jgi:hypothetical protein